MVATHLPRDSAVDAALDHPRAQAPTGPSAATVASRTAAAVFGGYAFTWGFTSLGIALGLATGMRYEQAQTLMYLLAFLVYLVVFCWAFAARSLGRVWLVLAGGGASMTGLAWLLLPP
jgi:hypothetical protein